MAYSRLRRTPMFRRRGSSRPENIANTSDCVNHRSILIELGTQSMHEHIYDVCLGIEAVIKNVFKDHGLGDRAISVAHEILEQGEFARLQLNSLAAPLHFAGKQIHSEVAHGEASGFGSLSGAPN